MPIEFTVYPDECDSFGHLNQASYLALFERARWEVLARGPGMDAFPRAGVWPAVRRAVLDFHAGAWPGDRLRFEVEVLHRGRTSFTLKQTAIRVRDLRLVATAEIVFVCIDEEEHPVPVPEAILAALGMEPRRVSLPTGVSLAVEDVGRGGTPLLLIHGYPLDREIWAQQLTGLRGVRMLAPDLRGFGQSEVVDGPATLATYTDDLIALLDHLEVPRVVLCGLSMGGYIALDLVQRYRDRVAGLILMATRAAADSPAQREGRDAALATLAANGAGPIVQGLGEQVFGAGTPASVREPVLGRMRRTAPAGIAAALGAMRDRPDATPLLATLGDIPTLVVAGAEDRLRLPGETQAMAAAIPGGRLVEIAGAGHLPGLEQPEATNQAIQEFLAGLSRG